MTEATINLKELRNLQLHGAQEDPWVAIKPTHLAALIDTAEAAIRLWNSAPGRFELHSDVSFDADTYSDDLARLRETLNRYTP